MNSNDQVLDQSDLANQPEENEPQQVAESSAPTPEAEAQPSESPMTEESSEPPDSM